MINKKTRIIDAIKEKPGAHVIMAEAGLHCMGCGGAAFESIEDGCSAHGLSEKQIDDIIKKINKSK